MSIALLHATFFTKIVQILQKLLVCQTQIHSHNLRNPKESQATYMDRLPLKASPIQQALALCSGVLMAFYVVWDALSDTA